MTTLQTNRLILRLPRDSDAQNIATQIGNYNVSKNLARVPHPYSLDDAMWFLNWSRNLDQKSLFVAICEKQMPGHLMGIMSYEYLAEKDNAELGYWLAEPFWGKGYMKETARAVVDHAFEVAELNELVSGFFTDNPNSGRVLAGVGFENVGQELLFSKAQGCDVPVSKMRLSRARWLATKKP